MFVYTIQPVVKPVVQPVVSCKRGLNVNVNVSVVVDYSWIQVADAAAVHVSHRDVLRGRRSSSHDRLDVSSLQGGLEVGVFFSS